MSTQVFPAATPVSEAKAADVPSEIRPSSAVSEAKAADVPSVIQPSSALGAAPVELKPNAQPAAAAADDAEDDDAKSPKSRERLVKRPCGLAKHQIITPLTEKECKKMQCLICHEIAWKPLAFRGCEHLVCTDCLARVKTEADKSKDGESLYKCVNCRKVDKVPLPLEGYARRDFADLRVRCPAYSEYEFAKGMLCDKEMDYYDGVRHLEDDCPFETAVCACNTKMPRHELKAHQDTTCPERLLECVHCHQSVASREMKTHVSSKCVSAPDAQIWCRVCRVTTGPGEFIKHMLENPARHASALVDEVQHPSHEWLGKRVTAKCYSSSIAGTVTGIRRIAYHHRKGDETTEAMVVWDDGDHHVHPLQPQTALQLAPAGTRKPPRGLKLDVTEREHKWTFNPSLEAPSSSIPIGQLLSALTRGLVGARLVGVGGVPSELASLFEDDDD